MLRFESCFDPLAQADQGSNHSTGLPDDSIAFFMDEGLTFSVARDVGKNHSPYDIRSPDSF